MSPFFKSKSLRVMRERMSWERKWRCWMMNVRHGHEQEERCTRHYSMQPAYAVWWRRTQAASKRKVDFRGQRGDKAQIGEVSRDQQVSLREMWKWQ